MEAQDSRGGGSGRKDRLKLRPCPFVDSRGASLYPAIAIDVSGEF